jgi:uncharacterized membrane protein YraQ (UPF0718 family)
MIAKIIRFFDRLEDRVRAALSRHPVLYTLIGGVAIVLFWRGIWMTADLLPWLTGPISLALSVLVLLITGLFVSFFIGENIIISGIKKEKKMIEKTEEEIKADIETEKKEFKEIEAKLGKIEKDLEEMKSKSS